MKSERYKTGLCMLMMAAGASFLAACATDVDGHEKVASEQNELTADKPTPDQSMATEGAVSAADATTSEKRSTIDGVISPRTPCRRVTASSIPVFTTTTGSTVSCRFLQGDVFSYFGTVIANGRFVTWCPRGVPPAQGHEAYAQAAGTVNGGCAP